MKRKSFACNPFFLIIFLCLAFFLRIYKINSIPPGFYLDEGMYGLMALDIIESIDRPPYFNRIYGVDAMFAYLTAISFNLFGLEPQSIRVVSAFVGTLTILGTYLLLKTILTQNVAILSCILLTFSRWHITISRIGFQVILLPLFIVLSFYWFFKGLKSKKKIDFILSGLVFGLGFYTYLPFRLMPLILLIFLVYKIFSEKKFFKGYLKLLILFVLTMSIVSLPLWIYFLNHPDLFFARAGAVLERKEIFSNFLKVILMLGFKGDLNPRHNIPGEPMLFLPVFFCFFGGFLMSMWRFLKGVEQEKYFFLLIWLITMLLPSVFSTEAPHALRTIGVIPVVYLFSGLFLSQTYEFLKRKFKKIAIFVLFLFFFGIGYYDVNAYFNRWAKMPEVKAAFGGFNLEMIEQLRLLASRYIVFLPLSLCTSPSITFLLRAKIATGFYCIYDINSFVFPEKPAKDVIYLISWLSENESKVSQLLRFIYPQAEKIGEITAGEKNVIYELYCLKKEHVRTSLSDTEKITIETILNRIKTECELTPWLKDQLSYCRKMRKYQ